MNPTKMATQIPRARIQIHSAVRRTFHRFIYIVIGDRHLNLNQQDHNLTVIKWLNWRVYRCETNLSLFDALFIRHGRTPFQKPLKEQVVNPAGNTTGLYIRADDC